MEFNKTLLAALIEWRNRQTQNRASVSLNAFAAYLGVSRPIVNRWLNENNDPSFGSLVAIAPKLAELLGPSVYDDLGLARPDKRLAELKVQYDQVPPEHKDEFLEEVRTLLASRGWAG